MEETYVFIDNAYLSLVSKHFGKGKYLKFDINQFAITIAKSQGLWCKRVYFYTAPPFQSEKASKEEAERKQSYDKFISKMKGIPNFIVREGRCQKVEGEYHQKGVDTLFTMDLLESRNDGIKTIIAVTCDTDFVPVLKKLKEHGIEVVLFYYSDFKRNSKFSMSNHILATCSKKVLIEYEHFKNSMKSQ